MCGICGIINFNKSLVSESNIKNMMRCMNHRGPNDEGLYIHEQIGLGFVRLSILDLSPAGHQPFISADNRYVLVFNGEVYNYLEIREELQKKGHKFVSNTDTEVILKSFIEWGEQGLDKFNGMWAFVIYDTINNTIFASRDRYGIKPFYYYKDPNCFIFASDVQPILKVLPVAPKPDDKSVYEFLITNRSNHTEATFFDNIKKLQHGYNLKINLSDYKIDIQRWYDLKNIEAKGFESSEEFKHYLTDAIKLQLRSDVPIGLSLSGGLDSSTIGASISKIFNRSDIHSFSAVYGEGVTGDESVFIREFKGYIDNIHFTTPTVDSFLEDMDGFVEALGEPVPSTTVYAEYKVMQLAKNYCTVVLNGQGVDEYMAGYHYFIGFYYKELFKKFNWGRIINDIYKYRKIHHSWLAPKSFIFYLLPEKLKEKFLIKKINYLHPDFVEQCGYTENNIIQQLYSANNLNDAFFAHFEYKFEHLLLWADKTGMKHSLEARFPYLDHRLVEKIINTKKEQIYKNGVTKIILRESMQGILPEKVRMRMDKVGFKTPEADWFRNEKFQKLIADIVNSESFKTRKYFKYTQVMNMIEEHKKGANLAKEIWKILHLELWLRKFFNQAQ